MQVTTAAAVRWLTLNIFAMITNNCENVEFAAGLSQEQQNIQNHSHTTILLVVQHRTLSHRGLGPKAREYCVHAHTEKGPLSLDLLARLQIHQCAKI